MIPATTSARLVLEDGSVWRGQACGASGSRLGEVVFNTSLTGYQEILTDPSYAGQIVVMTAPHIGNTGINTQDDEARQAFLSGFIVRDLSPRVSNWRAAAPLDTWLAAQGCPAISGIDTRALTRRLRDHGTMRGLLTTDPDPADADLIAQVRAWPGLDGIDMAQAVTCAAPYAWDQATDDEWEFRRRADRGATLGLRKSGSASPALAGEAVFHVVALDFGIKRNILRRLVTSGCRVTVVPAQTSAAGVLALHPDGVLLSNGPGDPCGGALRGGRGARAAGQGAGVRNLPGAPDHGAGVRRQDVPAQVRASRR